MAVTIKGVKQQELPAGGIELIQMTYTLTGTYATGGFVTPFSTAAGTLGTSPAGTRRPLAFDWYSPLGYIYVTTITTVSGLPLCTTKILSAPNTELTNAAAVPDATITCIITALLT